MPSSPTNLAAAPEIPTVEEVGLPGFYAPGWPRALGPRGTPRDVIARLSAALVDALADKAVRGSPALAWRFSGANSRRPTRSGPSRRRRSRGGGPSSRPRASRWSEVRLLRGNCVRIWPEGDIGTLQFADPPPTFTLGSASDSWSQEKRRESEGVLLTNCDG